MMRIKHGDNNNKMAKYAGNACMLICVFFSAFFFLPDHDYHTLQTPEEGARYQQLVFVEKLEAELRRIEREGADQPFTSVAPLLKGLREIMLNGTIYIASESAEAKVNASLSQAKEVFPNLEDLLNGVPEVRLNGTIYIACQYNQPNHGTIHSFTHMDSKERRFPKEAQEATQCMPYIAETHYNNGTTPSNRLFLGGGGPYYPPEKVNSTDEKHLIWPTSNTADAPCTLEARDLYWETPHNFQQLIRCFSWWQMPINKGKQPVLVIEKWGNLDNSTEGFGFIHSYYKAMSEAFNVRLEIEGKHNNKTIPVRHNSSQIIVEAPWRVDMDTLTDAYGMCNLCTVRSRDDHQHNTDIVCLGVSLPHSNEKPGTCPDTDEWHSQSLHTQQPE
jgi:hypothetical protein